MLRVIADLPVYVVVAVRFDEPRDDDNHQPLDYYLDAMIWCALRLGNHAQRGEIAYEGPHQVVVDHPPRPPMSPIAPCRSGCAASTRTALAPRHSLTTASAERTRR